MIYTTLNKIRAHDPCTYGWEKLLKFLGKKKADDKRLSMLKILDSNGLDDALWCLRACNGIDREARLFAVACARRVQHLMTDPASINALEVAERYANGQATYEELIAAWAAARAAATAAATAAAGDAARDAARAAWAAAGAAAGAAAWAAEAALAAAGAAAGAAAWHAERAWQEAEFKRVFCGG